MKCSIKTNMSENLTESGFYYAANFELAFSNSLFLSHCLLAFKSSWTLIKIFFCLLNTEAKHYINVGI